ncbi:MAG: LemA family protein [Candidatus Omnitrophica bacterium]|nr:LemA family protein [Candidatus Omnitrophota bacterium]
MSRKGAWGLVIALVVVLLLGLVQSEYNRLVSLTQKVKEAWAQVENVLQRRNDLIPNLVATVKGYAKPEKEVFLQVTEARSSLMRATTVPEKVQAANQLGTAIGRLLLVVENYPQLKANENFLRLQDELAGTENRIAVERKRYNEAVNVYNQTAKSFPTMIFVRLFGFEPEKPYFEAAPQSTKVPEVKFE